MCMSIISLVRRLRQANLELGGSLGYMTLERICRAEKKKGRKMYEIWGNQRVT